MHIVYIHQLIPTLIVLIKLEDVFNTMVLTRQKMVIKELDFTSDMSM